MGLSDTERFNGVCFAVSELSKIEPFEMEEHKPLNDLIGDLWPALLASSSNGMYWILGGDISSMYCRDISLITAAFSSVLSEVTSAKENDTWEDNNSYYVSHFVPNAESLLRDVWEYRGSRLHERSDVYKAFRITESFFYRANRYDDKFAHSLKPVSNLIAKIQGFCFEQFSTNPCYMFAWMTEHIFNSIWLYEDEDTVTSWCRKQNLHHDIKLRDLNKEIVEIFKEVQAAEKLSSQRRMEITLKFAGKGYHYDHHHNDLFKMIEDHNEKFENDQIDLSRIKELCNECKNAEEESDKRNVYTRYCHLTSISNPPYKDD